MISKRLLDANCYVMSYLSDRWPIFWHILSNMVGANNYRNYVILGRNNRFYCAIFVLRIPDRVLFHVKNI